MPLIAVQTGQRRTIIERFGESTNDMTAALSSLFGRYGGRSYRFEGTFSLSLANGNYATVPGDSVLDFTAAVLSCSGENHTDHDPTGFYLAPNTTDVEVIGARVKGSAAGVPWSIATLNRQAAAFTLGTTGNTGIERVQFRGFRCKDFYGFPIHAAAGGGSIGVYDAVLSNCHNGLNLNFDEVTIQGLTAYDSEGPELAGARLIVNGYTAVNAKVAGLAIGGWISAGTVRKGASRVSNVVIKGAQRQTDSAGGFGVLVADAVSDLDLVNVAVEQSDAAGFYVGQLSDGSANAPTRVTLQACRAIDCGWAGDGGDEGASTARFGFWSNRANVRHIGCTSVYTAADTDYRPDRHFHLNGADNGLIGCETSGAAITNDVYLNSGATGVLWDGNRFGGGVSKHASATIATATAAPS